MNVAIILAGGIGARLGRNLPKQFVEILGKPLIVYAMEIYESSPNIDAIEVVSIPEYIPYVWDIAERWGIKKLKWVTPGGASCQDSTRNGILALEKDCIDNDMIMLVMSTSVFVDEDIIEDSLKVCRKYGNAFASMQAIYNFARSDDGISSRKIEYKEHHKTLNMPWTAPFGTFNRLYKEAYAKGIETGQASYAPTLFLALGQTLYFSKDTAKNKIHVTTDDDLNIIEACLSYRQKKSNE